MKSSRNNAAYPPKGFFFSSRSLTYWLQPSHWLWPILFIALTGLAGISIWHSAKDREAGRMVLVSRPLAVMGTDCTIAAVVKGTSQQQTQKALVDCERRIRMIEAKMSTWLADSEISALNRNLRAELSDESLFVLRSAHEAYIQTRGAFDITGRPIYELWRRAGKILELPTMDELRAARKSSNWESIQFTETGAEKTQLTARVDLGGIAKGYGIDEGLDVFRDAGVTAGLVDIGGDLACFRPDDDPHPWSVNVRNPFAEGSLLEIEFFNGAVCTSGNYERFTEIDGKRHSHIIDPRTGWPAEAAPSVTVIAERALTADIWATAISVLGEEGLALMPEGIEALLITGNQEAYELVCTPGFLVYVKGEMPQPCRVWARE